MSEETVEVEADLRWPCLRPEADDWCCGTEGADVVRVSWRRCGVDWKA